MLISALSLKNPLITPPEQQAMETLQHLSTSKKDKKTRALELFKIAAKPLEVFFEEKLQYYISGVNQQPVLRVLCQQICHYGVAKESDFMDELVRQLQKPLLGSAEKCPALGHPDMHRVVKQMIKAEVAGGNDPALKFCTSVANVFMKNFEANIKSRAIFVLIELLETEETKELIRGRALEHKALVQMLAGEDPNSKGLQILLKLL